MSSIWCIVPVGKAAVSNTELCVPSFMLCGGGLVGSLPCGALLTCRLL